MTKDIKQSLYILFFLIFMMLIVDQAVSQNKFQINCYLQKNGVCSVDNKFIIKIIDDKNFEQEFNSVNYFKYELDYGHIYRFAVYNECCEAKYITIDTRTDKIKKVRYEFVMNLEEKCSDKVMFAGGIFYNHSIKRFDYYLN